MAIGSILGAGVGLVGALMQKSAQDQANQINWQNLFETRRANRKSEKLATSARTDASGNRVYFDQGANEWLTELTDTNRQILGRQEAETLLSLLEDAPRNRRAAERMDRRSQDADEMFEQAMLDYKYRPQRSERGAIAEEQQALLRNRRQGLSEASNMLAKQAIRSGDGAGIASFFKTADDLYAGSLDDAMYEGRQRGRQRFQQERSDDANYFMSILNNFSNLANQTTTSPVGSTDVVPRLGQVSEGALQSLLSTIGQNSGRLSQANAQLAAGLAQSYPNLGPVASALSSIQLPQRSSGTSTHTKTDRLRADVR